MICWTDKRGKELEENNRNGQQWPSGHDGNVFTDEVSQKGAKDMSQKNMKIMLRQEDKAEAEDFTAFLQSLNISKQMLMDTFMKGVKVGMCMATEKQSA